MQFLINFWSPIGFGILHGLYSTIARLYDVMNNLISNKGSIDNYSPSFSSTIYVLAIVFMLFRVTISMISYLIDPDKLNDRQAGAGKVLVRVITSILMLIIFVPNGIIFDKNTGILAKFQEAVLAPDGLVQQLLPNEDASGSINKKNDILFENVYADGEEPPLECYYVYVRNTKVRGNTNQNLNGNVINSKTITEIYSDKSPVHITFYSNPTSGQKTLYTKGSPDDPDLQSGIYSYSFDNTSPYYKTIDGTLIGPAFKNGWPSQCPKEISHNMIQTTGDRWYEIGAKLSNNPNETSYLAYVGGWDDEPEMFSALNSRLNYYCRNGGEDVQCASVSGNDISFFTQNTNLDENQSPEKWSIAGEEAVAFSQTAFGVFLTYAEEADEEDANYKDFIEAKNNIFTPRGYNKMNSLVEKDKVSVDFIIGAISGIGIFVWLIYLCVELIIRKFKLILLEMIAPIPIISYVDPNDKMFNQWGKMYISTYAELFIKLFAISFALELLRRVSDMVNGSGLELFFYIVAILVFAKLVPDMISKITGLNISSGSFKDIMGMGKKVLGIGAGAAIGTAIGVATGKGFGRVTGAFKGAFRGAGSGSKGDIYGGAKSIAATNALKKQGLNWFDRFEYQALGALGIDPNLMLREGTNKIKANVDHTSAIQKAAFGVDDALDRIPIVAALKREIANGNIQDPEGTKLKAFKEKVAGALDHNSGKLLKSEYDHILDKHDRKKLGINGQNEVDLALNSYAQDYFTQKEYLGLQLELAKEDTRAIDYIRNDGTLDSVDKLYQMTASRNSSYDEVQKIKTATFDATKELNKAWERANQELNIADRKRKSS